MVLASGFRGLRPPSGPAASDWDDLSHLQPRSRDFEAQLDRAMRDLTQRRADGRLVLDEGPRVTTLWAQGPGDAVTAGIVVALDLTATGDDRVLPHEGTFAEPVQRRVRTRNRLLTESAATLLVLRSPVPALERHLDEALRRPPTAVHRAADVVHRAVSDPAADLADVLEALRGTPALVADGHHRLAAATDPDAIDRGRALVWLTSAARPPVMQPVHRLIRSRPGDLVERLERAGLELVPTEPHPHPGTPVLVRAEGIHELRVRPGSPTHEAIERVPPSLRQLGVTLADHVTRTVLDVGTTRNELLTTTSAQHVLDEVGHGRQGLGLLLGDPDLDDVWRAADDGVRMPAKATWFTPKTVPGAVLRPLETNGATS